jgi:iron complex outermembrane receptor protein
MPSATALEALEVVVEEERDAGSASEEHLDAQELAAFPACSTDELLRAMSGLHQSAHGGHGKAYQYFLRGFDAVHGADLAVTLEGIPLNEPSNIHGHGYLDLHFIPSLLVRGLDLYKGSARPQSGDFDIAGAADLRLGLDRRALWAELGGGTDRSATAALAWGPEDGEPGDFLVAELDAGLGVGDHHAWRQLRAAGGLEGALGAGSARLFLLGYDGAFDSPGVLRASDVERGLVDFYGAYPEAGDGRSTRALAGASWLRAGSGGTGAAVAWLGYRALELRRNFTGYLLHPDEGDGVRQAQRGLQAGARLRGSRGLRGERLASTLQGGLDLRGDLARQEEQGVTVDGVAWGQRVDADFLQGELAAWAGAELELGAWATVSPGLRAALMGLGLQRRIDDSGQPVEELEVAWSGAPVLAPKASAVLAPEAPLSGFASYGRGYRSPEARGIEDGDRAPFTQADSGELGLRWRPRAWLLLRAAAFRIDISNEMVFDHAAARFLSEGATRRHGAEASAEITPRDDLKAELELSWADGRSVATGEPLPYAPRWLCSLGLYALGWERGEVETTAGLRLWALGPRPLPEGFYSQAALVADLELASRWEDWELGIELDNLFGTRWRDGEFVYPSCFDADGSCSELPALHLTAGEPFALHLSLGRRI